MLKKLLFILRQRLLSQSRIAWSVRLEKPARIRLGRHNRICHSAQLEGGSGKGIRSGDQVIINSMALLQASKGGIELGHRVEINNFSIINGTGGVRIGDDTLIGPGVKVISYTHQHDDLTRPIREQPCPGLPVNIGANVWIGANAVILGGVSIGDGAIIAAGAIVNRDVPPLAVMAGVPARQIKQRG